MWWTPEQGGLRPEFRGDGEMTVETPAIAHVGITLARLEREVATISDAFWEGEILVGDVAALTRLADELSALGRALGYYAARVEGAPARAGGVGG